MAWKTGTVNQFTNNGSTNGLLQEVIDFCAGTMTEETLGTGDGTTLQWTKTLAATPGLGQLRVRFSISGVKQEAWDNGEGKFSHALVNYADSSFDYGTKELVFKTTEPISNGYVIKVKYASVNANGNDWFVERQANTKNNSGVDAFPGLLLQEIVLKNSGLSYKDFYGVGIREYQYVAQATYNWNLNIYKSFTYDEENYLQAWNCNSSFTGFTSYSTNYNNYNQHMNLNLNDSSIPYWIFCNRRRIIVAVRLSNSNYYFCYIGALRRISSPVEYPSPLIACGSSLGDYSYTYTNCKNPGTYTSNWFHVFTNHGTNSVGGSGDFILPGGREYTDRGPIKKDKNNDILILQDTISHYVSSNALDGVTNLGELDGVFRCPMDGVASEDEITVGSDTYILFQNVGRITRYDYTAIKRE